MRIRDFSHKKLQAHHPEDTSSSSGFIGTFNPEENISKVIPIECGYSNVHECYVSKSGHTRLFTATKYGKRYILKCLKSDYLYTPLYQQALTKEFEIGLQLEHPNICRTLGLEHLPKLGDTIMIEYIDGCPLSDLIAQGMLTAELAQKITRQLMEALAYMHSKQIIHRDLKPANIMITHVGKNAKIIDFGLSDSDAFHILKLPAGTSGYIAPEQLLPGATSNPSADIYSLGKVLADMGNATNNHKLKHIATICMASDTHIRPNSIENLRKSLTAIHSHKRTLIILSLLVAALSILITITYLTRNQAHDKSSIQSDTTQGHTTYQDENKIIDYHLWK